MRQYSIHELLHLLVYAGLPKDGVRAIFWGTTIRQFAMSAVGLYVPLFVYRLGTVLYGGSVADGMRTLLVYLILVRLSDLGFSLIVEHLVDWVGFRRTLLLSSILLCLKFVLLALSEGNPVLLWLSAVVVGGVTAMYWIPRHALFGEDQDIHRVGRSLGLVVVLTQISAFLGPALGGIVASVFGYPALFRLGLGLALASGVPYFFMHHHRRHHPDGWKGFVAKFNDPVNRPLMAAWLGRSWDNELVTNLWPVYVFLVVGAVERFGILMSAVAVVSIGTAYVAGKVFDAVSNRKRLYLLGALATAGMWPVKGLARSFWGVFAVDALDKAVNPFYWLPALSLTYRFSFRRDTVAFFAFREIIMSAGSIGFCLLAFLLVPSWPLLFLLGSAGVLVSTRLIAYRGFYD